MKSKRLATLSLIIMALVSTPRAMQQLSNSLSAAQERAGLIWWDLLLTRDMQTTESERTKNNRCTQPIAARLKSSDETLTARSVVRQRAAQASTNARKAQRQSASSDSSELAVNNYPADQDSSHDLLALGQQSAAKQQQHALQNFVPTTAAAQETGRGLMSPEIQQALASLKERQAPDAPTIISVAGELEDSEAARIPGMDALKAALAKRGFNVQFRLRKVMDDGNALPRAKGRPQINKSTDYNLISGLEGHRQQCPAG